MTNQTPPAWATQAAIQLSALDDDDSITLEYMAEVIARCSPDAEALAVALENVINPKTGNRDYTSAINTLAAYRARFPKVTP